MIVHEDSNFMVTVTAENSEDNCRLAMEYKGSGMVAMFISMPELQALHTALGEFIQGQN